MSLLDDVVTRGQALVLHGEPGIGKSRLLSETERAARERGMAVLATAGVQSEAHLPFAGLHQLLAPQEVAALSTPVSVGDVEAAGPVAVGAGDDDATSWRRSAARTEPPRPRLSRALRDEQRRTHSRSEPQ